MLNALCMLKIDSLYSCSKQMYHTNEENTTIDESQKTSVSNVLIVMRPEKTYFINTNHYKYSSLCTVDYNKV